MGDVQTRVRITPVVSGASSARQDIASIFRELQDGKRTVESANQALRELGESERAQVRALRLLRTQYKNNHAELMSLMGTLRGVASIGRTLTSIYQTYTLGQIRVADKTRDIRDSEERLAKVQEMRRQIVRDLGADNVYALKFMDEEERLTKRLTEEKRDLSRAQRDNAMGYVSMGLSAIQIIPSLELVYRHSRDFIDLVGDKGFKATALETISTTAIAAKTEVAALQASLSGLSTIGAIAIPVAITLAIAYEFTKKPEEIRQDIRDYIIGTEGRGPGGAPDWGMTWEQLTGDLPPGSPLMDVYTGAPNVNVTVEGTNVDVEVDVDVSVSQKGGGGKNKYGGNKDKGGGGGSKRGGGGSRRR